MTKKPFVVIVSLLYTEGELEQISAFIVKDIKPASQIVSEVWNEFLEAKKKLCERF